MSTRRLVKNRREKNLWCGGSSETEKVGLGGNPTVFGLTKNTTKRRLQSRGNGALQDSKEGNEAKNGFNPKSGKRLQVYRRKLSSKQQGKEPVASRKRNSPAKEIHAHERAAPKTAGQKRNETL